MARNLVLGAYESSQKLLDKAVDRSMAESAQPREREVVDRYRALHKGNALAMADYVRREVSKRAPASGRVNLLTEMQRYEKAMGALEKKYGLARKSGGR